MTFLTKDSSTTSVFFHTKLTDHGRRQLSLGKLSFNKLTILDREIDYSFPILDNIYEDNFIFSPKDSNPLTSQNLNGAEPISIPQPVIVGSRRMTGETESWGLFSSATSIENFRIDATKYLSYTTVTTSDINGSRTLPVGGLQNGGLVMAKFCAPAGGQPMLSGNTPFVCLWYRYTGTTSSITLDRSLPNFSSGAESVPLYFYP
jgi:hypothetical protein